MNLKGRKLHQITFTLAIIGLLVTIAGNFFDISITKKLCYFVGTVFLLTPAVLERNTFFIILEIILMIGTIIAFFPVAFIWKSSIPVGLGIIAAIYFGFSGQLKDYLTWLSVIGILVGTWGYAVTNPIIYFCAGTIITTYSFCSFRRGETIALVFGILNVIFTVTALLEILHVL
ncbi:MAG: hypothetical protein PVI75_00630 [Gammaproteobacteria bacterium]|jgi:hypothetical protein